MPASVIYHPRYRDYYFGPEHPFSPVRLEMLQDLLQALGRWVEPVEPAPATREDVLTVHDEAYVAAVEAASTGEAGSDAAAFGIGTTDVPAFAGMDEAARSLVGGALEGARQISSGRAARALHLGGGLHHAQQALASGFCVYNDLSVAIRHLRDQGMRVAYLDVDVHHGDGVQFIHYREPGVLTLSLHESGKYLFPGTGGVHEIGEGDGRGYKLNVPLEPGTSDASYLEAFERVAPHVLSWFHPDVLVVMCGADAHFNDPLADLLLTTRAFEQVFRHTVELADTYAGGRALFTLGGGYDFDATVRIWTILYLILQQVPLPDDLPRAWRERWEERLGRRLTPTLHDPPQDFTGPNTEAMEHQNRLTSRRLMELAVKFWY